MMTERMKGSHLRGPLLMLVMVLLPVQRFWQ
jgi:hypothetical protein